jgi:hypothetical protein
MTGTRWSLGPIIERQFDSLANLCRAVNGPNDFDRLSSLAAIDHGGAAGVDRLQECWLADARADPLESRTSAVSRCHFLEGSSDSPSEFASNETLKSRPSNMS